MNVGFVRRLPRKFVGMMDLIMPWLVIITPFLIIWLLCWWFLSSVYRGKPEPLSLWTPFIMAVPAFVAMYLGRVALVVVVHGGSAFRNSRLLRESVARMLAVVGFCLAYLSLFFLEHEFINAILIGGVK